MASVANKMVIVGGPNLIAWDEFSGKKLQKLYLALVIGDPGPVGHIDAPLRKAGGKGAEKIVVDHVDGQTACTDFLRLDKSDYL